MPELIICCANRSVYELLVERTSDDFKFQEKNIQIYIRATFIEELH